jgi:hypothetical protein
MNSNRLSSRRWRRVRAQVLATSNLCHICGHTGAGEGDHLITRAQGGQKYDPENVLPAHGYRSRCWECDSIQGRACNQSRGAGLNPTPRGGRGHPHPTPLEW